MIIRKTVESDVSAAAEIYENARKFMRESGNLHQWDSAYPNADTVREDIADGHGYVCEEDGEVIAVFYFRKGEDPTYLKIYDGAWLKEGEYAVIHRIAVKYHGRGIADYIFSECFKLWPNLRIDTHRDNVPMQRALEKSGFRPCGVIYLASGDERIAFQKIDV